MTASLVVRCAGAITTGFSLSCVGLGPYGFERENVIFLDTRCCDRTREFHQVLDRIVDSVEQLNPPADMAPLQRELVAAARESVRTVGQAADDVGDGKLHCGRSMNRRIYGLPSTARA